MHVPSWCFVHQANTIVVSSCSHCCRGQLIFPVFVNLSVVIRFFVLNFVGCAGFALAICNLLKWTINSPRANASPAAEANFEQVTYRSLKRPPQVPLRWVWFVKCAGLICLAARWSGPATSVQEVSAIFGLYPLRLVKSAGFVSLAGKTSFVSTSEAALFYEPSVFIYCWSSIFLEKLVLERERWRLRLHLVPLTLCIILYGGWFWAIIIKVRLSSKDNNK